jgi:hypothetical protein
MKNIIEVLRQKEQELQQLQIEVEALRVAIRLVSEDGDSRGLSLAPTGTSSDSRVTERSASTSAVRQFP